MLINQREVKFKRPTLRIERDARILVTEFVEAGEREAKEPTEENFAVISAIWKRFVDLILVDSPGMEYENLTRGEVEEISAGFFALAQAKPNSGSGPGT